MIFVIGYVLVGLVVAVFVARAAIADMEPEDAFDKFGCGLAGMGAGAFWPVIVPAFVIYAIARRLR